MVAVTDTLDPTKLIEVILFAVPTGVPSSSTVIPPKVPEAALTLPQEGTEPFQRRICPGDAKEASTKVVVFAAD